MSLKPLQDLGRKLAAPLRVVGLGREVVKDTARVFWEAGITWSGMGGDTPSEEQYAKAADFAQVPRAAIKAIWQLETRQIALLNGRPLIRIEPHKWVQFGGKAKDLPKPLNPGGYKPSDTEKGQALRWINFDKLHQIDPIRAIVCTSWGGGQIMGFNAELCGYNSERAFYQAQLVGAGSQLMCSARFIAHPKNRRLQVAMQKVDAKQVAFHWNGPRFAENAYDEKYAAAVRRFV